MKFTVDRDLITEQMTTLGLSERALVTDTGISYATIRDLRITGQLVGTITLRNLDALCQALGIEVADLLPPATPETATATPTAGDDAEHLIPLLLNIPTRVAFDRIAQALEWDQARTRAAIDAIPGRLHGTGMRLHEANGQIKIIPVVRTNKATRTALRRVRTASTGVNTLEATTLTRILDGHNVLDRQPSNATRVALGALKNMGCIALDINAIYRPSDQIHLALPDL